MTRTEYLHKCRIAETYFTNTKGSHEPGYIIPLLANRGKMKYFPLPLYHFNKSGEGHSRSELFARMEAFYFEYDRLNNIAISSLPGYIMDEQQKARLIETSRIGKFIRLYGRAFSLIDGDEHIEAVFMEILGLFNTIFGIEPPIIRAKTTGVEEFFILAAYKALTGGKANTFTIPSGRIIGYGAMGKAATKLLPHLKGTQLEPTELWDVNGNGGSVKKPDFTTLQPDDLVLSFPTGRIENELRERFADLPFQVLYNAELREWLTDAFFGEHTVTKPHI